MKHLFIPAKVKTNVNNVKILEISKKLPKKIAIAYSIQYKEIGEQIRDILLKNEQNNSIFSGFGLK